MRNKNLLCLVISTPCTSSLESDDSQSLVTPVIHPSGQRLPSHSSQRPMTPQSFIPRGQRLPSHSSQRPMTPQSFIPVANDSPVIHPSGQWLPSHSSLEANDFPVIHPSGQWLPSHSSQWPMTPQSMVHVLEPRTCTARISFTVSMVAFGNLRTRLYCNLRKLLQVKSPFLGIWLRNQISCNCILQRVSNIWGNHCPNWHVNLPRKQGSSSIHNHNPGAHWVIWLFYL